MSTPKTKHCGEKHCGETNFLVYSQDETLRRETCGETAWLYNFLVYSQDKLLRRETLRRETLWRDRLVGSCRVERGYNFLVYSQDKTLWRETLWRDRLVVQSPCILPRQNIVARNIVARPPGCTISLYIPKIKHCGEKHCGETGWLVLVVWKGDTISLYTSKTKHCDEKHCGETGWFVLVV